MWPSRRWLIVSSVNMLSTTSVRTDLCSTAWLAERCDVMVSSIQRWSYYLCHCGVCHDVFFLSIRFKANNFGDQHSWRKMSCCVSIVVSLEWFIRAFEAKRIISEAIEEQLTAETRDQDACCCTRYFSCTSQCCTIARNTCISHKRSPRFDPNCIFTVLHNWCNGVGQILWAWSPLNFLFAIFDPKTSTYVHDLYVGESILFKLRQKVPKSWASVTEVITFSQNQQNRQRWV